MGETIANDGESEVAAFPLIPGADFRQRKASYFEGVQCLRFFAAFLVVIAHSTFYAQERLPAAGVVEWHAGTAGVDIFFVISGFVMMMTMPRFVGSPIGWADFGLRRLARIFPPYWLATTIKLLTLIVIPTQVLHAKLDWNYVTKSYLFIPAFNSDHVVEPLLGVGWTLLFEMMFYLLCTVALAIRINTLAFMTVVIGACYIGSFFHNPRDSPAFAIYLSPYMIEFLLGMYIARYANRLRVSLAVAASLIVAGALLLLLHPFSAFGIFILSRSLPSAVIVIGVVALEPHLSAFPRSLVFMGAASYSLYLMHPLTAPIVPAVLAKLNVQIGVLSVIGSVAIAMLAAIIAFILVERPIGNLMAKLIGRYLWTPR